MAARTLRVVYRGPGVEDGLIDVVEFGTSLVGLAELVHDAGKFLNPEGQRVSVRIKPGFRKGSFELDVVLELYEKLLPVLQGMDPAVAISVVLFGAAAIPQKGREAIVGVVGLWAKLKGHRPEKVEPSGQDNVVVHIHGDNNTVTVNRVVLDLALDDAMQKDAQKFSSILHEGRIEEVSVEDEEVGVRGRLGWRERPFIDALALDRPDGLETERSKVWLYPTRPAFKDSYTWWFEQRGEKLVAEMQDEGFKDRLRRRGVRPGDAYYVEMVSTFPRPGGKGSPRHVITKVLKERRAPKQREFGDEE